MRSRSIPANVSTQTPATTGNANFFSGSTIANLRGLNPFFGSRTLNLVNSRRFVPTNQGDGVDLNFIPSILIDRIDIVTGGASAAYGSGAIAGREQHLPQPQARRRQGRHRLRPDRRRATARTVISVSRTAWASRTDRAHVVLGYEYQKTDAVGCLQCARLVRTRARASIKERRQLRPRARLRTSARIR